MEISRRHLMPAEAAERMEHHHRIGSMTQTELQQAFPNDDLDTLLAMQQEINSKLAMMDEMRSAQHVAKPPSCREHLSDNLTRNQRRVRNKLLRKATKRK